MTSKFTMKQLIYNTELSDLRKIICFRKSKDSVERISVCNVIENLVEHGIHSLPIPYQYDVTKITFWKSTKCTSL